MNPEIQFKYKKFQADMALDGSKYSFGINDIPLGGPFTGKFSISNENVRVGAGVGISEVGYAGGFLDYDFESGQLGVGAEVQVLDCLFAEGIARYNLDDDVINFKASVDIFDQKIDLVNLELKDVEHNTIGKGIDNIRHGIDDFIQHVSPEEREKRRAIEDIRNDAQNVHDFHGLRDIVNKIGENELLVKGNEAMFELHQATANYLEDLDNRTTQNTRDIQRHEYILQKHEDRLNEHDKILSNHENRLNRHEHILQVHSAILSNHEKRLNRHEQ